MYAKVNFKYYKPNVFNVLSVAITLFTIAISVSLLHLKPNNYLAFSFLSAPIFGILGLHFLLLKYIGNNYKDKKGAFTFQSNGAVLEYENKNVFLPYNNIDAIMRECYTLSVDLGITGGTTTNGNQYRIIMDNGQAYVFRVAHSEEKAYTQAIRKLEKKIFNTPRLIGLTSQVIKNNLNNKQREAKFEREKPDTNYTLVKAINGLLKQTGLELIEEA